MHRTSHDIRMANRFAVLRHIITEAPVTRPEIAAETGLSLATVATLVSELLEHGMVAEIGQQESAGGRPRGVLAVNPGRGVLVGVDVTETYVHVELFDLNLGVLARAHRVLAPDEDKVEQVLEHIVSAVGEGIDRCGERAGPDRSGVLGVGVSVPGQVDITGGVTVFAANWDWVDVPLRDMLSERIRLPVYLDNPPKASAVAELWFGASRGYDDVAVLTLATGVGAGIAVGGSLYRGADNAAGEWGHTTLVMDGRPCRCGGRGCVEAYVGAPGIVQHVRELAPESGLLQGGNGAKRDGSNGNTAKSTAAKSTATKSTAAKSSAAKSTGARSIGGAGTADQTATVAALAHALAAQEPLAGEVVTVTARHLGVAIANLVNLVNPQLVVLSGWVANRLGRYLLDEVCEVVAREALPGPQATTRIALCPIENPVTLGAATFALEGYLASVKDWS